MWCLGEMPWRTPSGKQQQQQQHTPCIAPQHFIFCFASSKFLFAFSSHLFGFYFKISSPFVATNPGFDLVNLYQPQLGQMSARNQGVWSWCLFHQFLFPWFIRTFSDYSAQELIQQILVAALENSVVEKQ